MSGTIKSLPWFTGPGSYRFYGPGPVPVNVPAAPRPLTPGAGIGPQPPDPPPPEVTDEQIEAIRKAIRDAARDINAGAFPLAGPAPKEYPHKCPESGCGSPAYIGLNQIDCSNEFCKNHREQKTDPGVGPVGWVP